MEKGTIALDIDKTITDSTRKVPDKVVSYLDSLQKMGYTIIFVTGREYVFAMDAISKCPFPYFLGAQNGADLLQFPERKHLKSFYFSKEVPIFLDSLFQEMEEDFLLYSGYERGDFCYYRPHQFSEAMKKYIKTMQKRSARPWKAVESFSIDAQNSFPLIKAIGKFEKLIDLEAKILKNFSLEFVIIQDPGSSDYQYLLLTDAKATKGNAINYFMEEFSLKRPLIAAGDDMNDVKSLEVADIAIAMENAPMALKSKADIVAPSADECGIINGLEEALKRC